ncbi:hypothetical protein G7054_g14972 [Neopestalotiopsis clavispora]|nr:hypothetical protein G7054_g14972 [Neopestalotiopsis clavispora]
MASGETTPLLAASPSPRTRADRDKWTYAAWSLVFVVNFFLYTGQSTVLAPRIQIYESIICRDYASRDLPAAALPGVGRCKEQDVQAELAFVLGIEEFLGVFLSIVFEAVGGGITVTTTMLNLIMLNLVSDESRTRNFLYINASTLLATIVGQVMSTLTMYVDVWCPVYIGCAFTILSFGLSFVLSHAMTRCANHPPLSAGSARTETGVGDRSVRTLVSEVPKMVRKSLAVLRSNPHIIIVLFSFFAFPLGEDSMFTVVLLYISKRYGWSIADANFLVAFSSVARLSTFLVVIPGLGYVMSKYFKLTRYVRDRVLVQVEGVLLLIGALCTALAPTVALAIGGIVLMSFGMAVLTILRSVMTDLVPRQDITLIYSAATMMMRAGSGVAGPLFAWAFGFGMKLGTAWTGLPFIISAAFFFSGIVALMFLPKMPQNTEVEELPQDAEVVI